jgi:cytochrome c
MDMGTAWRAVCRALACAVAAGWCLAAASPALADDAEDGRPLYAKTCSKCHGLIAEDKLSWTPEALLQQAVTMPLGPPLTGVFGRPAGIMPDYPYSRAFRALATGWVWDRDALDVWLTSSQDFARGSTMFLRVKQPTRGKIIAYLERYARYKPE